MSLGLKSSTKENLPTCSSSTAKQTGEMAIAVMGLPVLSVGLIAIKHRLAVSHFSMERTQNGAPNSYYEATISKGDGEINEIRFSIDRNRRKQRS